MIAIRSPLLALALAALPACSVPPDMPPPNPTPLNTRADAELHDLHAFFQAWFNGDLPDTDHAFAPFASALCEDFTIISPSGSITHRAALLGRLRSAHATDRSQPIRIWIQNPYGRYLSDDLYLITYEEWQTRGTDTRGRLSTALFRNSPHRPNGIEWVHVHETWLPSAATPDT